MTLPVYRSLADALMAMARFNPTKTMTQIASEMGWTVQQLSDATDPNKKPRFAADWLIPFTLTTNDFAGVRTICKMVGGVFFQPCRQTSHAKYKASTLKEFAEYLGVLAKNEPNGFTRPEIDELENEVHDVISCMLAHLDKLKAEAR